MLSVAGARRWCPSLVLTQVVNRTYHHVLRGDSLGHIIRDHTTEKPLVSGSKIRAGCALLADNERLLNLRQATVTEYGNPGDGADIVERSGQSGSTVSLPRILISVSLSAARL